MNNMKEVKIIQSTTEPNKNHLWLSDGGLKQFKGNGWEQVLSNDNGGSGGGSGITYYDISKITESDEYGPLISEQFKMCCNTFKMLYGDRCRISSWGLLLGDITSIEDISLILPMITSIEINLELKFSSPAHGTIVTLKQGFLEVLGGDEDRLNKILEYSQITEEQFYNLNE